MLEAEHVSSSHSFPLRVRCASRVSACRAQVDFIWDQKGSRTCDHTLCYEHLSEDFDPMISKLLGGPSIDPHCFSQRHRPPECPPKRDVEARTWPVWYPWGSIKPTVFHAPSNLTPAALPRVLRNLVAKFYARDRCWLGYDRSARCAGLGLAPPAAGQNPQAKPRLSSVRGQCSERPL